MKQEFKRIISWNKYRPEITTLPKTNNLDYIIDPKFRNIDRLSVRLILTIMMVFLKEFLFISIA